MEPKQIKIFKEGPGQWACRLNFIENIDIDVAITELSQGYITDINVARAEYRDGLVLCNALDGYDVYIKASEHSGAAGEIIRNHLKLPTAGKPEMIKIYKFEFNLVYEGS